MNRILIIVGTRPEAIKLIPVYKEFKRLRKYEVLFVSTGQHREMLDSIFKLFNVKPDVDLKIMTKNQSLQKLTTVLLKECMNIIEKFSPRLIIVQGDTTTAMASALAAYYSKVAIAHIEAGLRSYDIQAPFPEEVNRRVISLVSDFHFAPTKEAVNVLKRERVPGRIFLVGNTVIDSLLFAKQKIQRREKFFMAQYNSVLQEYEHMILITGHRRESFGSGFQNICRSIKTLASQYPQIAFLYPVHLNPNVRNVVFKMLHNLKNVYLVEPVPYDHMVFLMMKCKIILTDSGGIQEEAPSLGKPVVVMRSKTERPEGVLAGCSVLAGTSVNKIVSLVTKILENKATYSSMAKGINPYGKGDSAKRIVKILKRELQ